MNLAATLERRCAERGWAQRPAVREPGRTWSHGAIHDLAGRAARVLASEGIRPGDRVLLALPDSAAWVVSFLAVARAGAVAVLVNPALAAPEHTALVADCTPALVLCPESLADRFTVRTLSPNQLLDRAGRASRAPAVPVAGTDPLYVQYTSGTTGDPKGAVHRHTDPEAYYRYAGLSVVRSNADDAPSRSPSCTSPTASATPSCSHCSPDRRRCCCRSDRVPRRSRSSSPSTGSPCSTGCPRPTPSS